MRVDVTTDLDVLKKLKKDKNKKMIALKQEMVKDINTLVPLGSVTLRNSVLKSAKTPTKFITWDTPYAHFQWFGKVMIGVKSHNPWAHKYEKKVYTNRNLTYRSGGKDWFAKASDRYLNQWIDFLKKLYTR